MADIFVQREGYPKLKLRSMYGFQIVVIMESTHICITVETRFNGVIIQNINVFVIFYKTELASMDKKEAIGNRKLLHWPLSSFTHCKELFFRRKFLAGLRQARGWWANFCSKSTFLVVTAWKWIDSLETKIDGPKIVSLSGTSNEEHGTYVHSLTRLSLSHVGTLLVRVRSGPVRSPIGKPLELVTVRVSTDELNFSILNLPSNPATYVSRLLANESRCPFRWLPQQ